MNQRVSVRPFLIFILGMSQSTSANPFLILGMSLSTTVQPADRTFFGVVNPPCGLHLLYIISFQHSLCVFYYRRNEVMRVPIAKPESYYQLKCNGST